MDTDKCFATKSDLAKAYADRLGITCKEAKQRIEDMTEIFINSLVDPQNKGIMIRNFFTIEKTIKPARKGKMPVNGVAYKTPSVQKLKINTGKILSEKLNGKWTN